MFGRFQSKSIWQLKYYRLILYEQTGYFYISLWQKKKKKSKSSEYSSFILTLCDDYVKGSKLLKTDLCNIIYILFLLIILDGENSYFQIVDEVPHTIWAVVELEIQFCFCT